MTTPLTVNRLPDTIHARPIDDSAVIEEYDYFIFIFGDATRYRIMVKTDRQIVAHSMEVSRQAGQSVDIFYIARAFLIASDVVPTRDSIFIIESAISHNYWQYDLMNDESLIMLRLLDTF